MGKQAPHPPCAVFQVVSSGSGATWQDAGRPGYARCGVPHAGPMDDLAMAMANQLVGATDARTALEVALTGLRLKALRDVAIAVTGTDGEFAVGSEVYDGWRTIFCPQNEIFEIRKLTRGVWTYVAVPGGFDAPITLGSASPLPDAGKGVKRRDVLRVREPGAELPPGVAGRRVSHDARRQTREVAVLRLWPGSGRESLTRRALATLMNTEWTVSKRCGRVGYRLSGPRVNVERSDAPLEPIPPGALQIGPDGRPVVAMRDAPTLGNDVQVGVLDPNDVGRLAQCRCRQKVRFVWARTGA